MKEFKTAFDQNFLEDLQHWSRQNPRTIQRIIELMKAIQKNPFEGIGAPEKLKGTQNRYSRRIDREHRLVYTITSDCIVFQQCRYHYEK